MRTWFEHLPPEIHSLVGALAGIVIGVVGTKVVARIWLGRWR